MGESRRLRRAGRAGSQVGQNEESDNRAGERQERHADVTVGADIVDHPAVDQATGSDPDRQGDGGGDHGDHGGLPVDHAADPARGGTDRPQDGVVEPLPANRDDHQVTEAEQGEQADGEPDEERDVADPPQVHDGRRRIGLADRGADRRRRFGSPHPVVRAGRCGRPRCSFAPRDRASESPPSVTSPDWPRLSAPPTGGTRASPTTRNVPGPGSTLDLERVPNLHTELSRRHRTEIDLGVAQREAAVEQFRNEAAPNRSHPDDVQRPVAHRGAGGAVQRQCSHVATGVELVLDLRLRSRSRQLRRRGRSLVRIGPGCGSTG